MKGIFIGFVAALVCATASASTSYQLAGPKYATTAGTGYTTNMSIVGSITTANPLPANMPLTDIGPLGSNLATAWSFSDGVNTFTQTTSGPFEGTPRNFRVATNAAGKISLFSVKLMSPSASNATVGGTVNVLTLSTLPESRGEKGGVCTEIVNSVCKIVSDGPNYGTALSTSAIDVDGDGRADALTDGLLVLRYLFALRGAALIQGAVSAGATRTTSADIEAWLSTFAP